MKVLFYLTKNQNRRIKTEEDKVIFHTEIIDDIILFRVKHGNDGFLSEKTYPENIPSYAENRIEQIEKQDSCHSILKSITVTEDNEQEVRSSVESDKNFIRWIQHSVDKKG